MMLANLNNKKGFTLAEVLITLAIIGVVASMTIPALMNNVNDEQYKVEWKSIFSDFSQAYLRVLTDTGHNFANVAAMRDAFLPYMITANTCTYPQTGCWHSASTPAKTMPLSDGTQYNLAVNPYTNSVSGLVLNNGALVIFYWDSAAMGWMMTDVNGFKGPNVLGKDIFGARFNGTTTTPFSEIEMGACSPAAAGVAGNGYIGLGCSSYYLTH